MSYSEIVAADEGYDLRGPYIDAMQFWHGGVPGLGPDDLILPASETNASQTEECQYEGPVPYWREFVYVTKDLDIAALFARTYRVGPGHLYEVKPIGRLWLDWDCRECFRCQRARVIRQVDGPELQGTRARIQAKGW
jgi:hypothetical protein